MPIPQDTNVGSTIMRVSATDVDEAENQRVSFQYQSYCRDGDKNMHSGKKN